MRPWLLALITLGVFLPAGWLLLRGREPAVHDLTITAGSAKGARHLIALRLAQEAGQHGLKIRALPTQGSQEALDRVNRGEFDLALIQGGLAIGERTAVRQVATLYVEPLHLLVRDDQFDRISQGLDGLSGKRINTSKPGSGTSTLSLEVLDFMGLPRSEFVHMQLGYGDLLDLSRQDLPDAVFMVSSLPSQVAESMVRDYQYRLVPIDFARAFAMSGVLDPELVRAGLVPEHIYEAEIPAYTYSVAPAVPAETIKTIGTRLLVVAHRETSADAVERLISVIYDSSFAKIADPPLAGSLLAIPSEMPWHLGTRNYLKANRPLIQADLIDLAEKLVAIGAALLGGLLCTYTWLVQRLRRLRLRGLQAYVGRIADIERETLEMESDLRFDVPRLLTLRRQLSKLKSEVLERFTQGELLGEQLMAGFLIHVGDVRDHLTALILHQRSKQTDRQARTPGGGEPVTPAPREAEPDHGPGR
jgi:TRAP transporter TAXI family solute receptor